MSGLKSRGRLFESPSFDFFDNMGLLQSVCHRVIGFLDVFLVTMRVKRAQILDKIVCHCHFNPLGLTSTNKRIRPEKLFLLVF